MSTLQDIVDMFGKGGFEITTFADNDEAGAGRLPLFRTVIQPNANIITWVDPGEENEQAWERHHGKLQGYVQSIRRIRQRLNSVASIAALATIVFLNAVTIDFNDPITVLAPLIARLLISIAGVFLLRVALKYTITYGLRWYIGKQLKKAMSNL